MGQFQPIASADAQDDSPDAKQLVLELLQSKQADEWYEAFRGSFSDCVDQAEGARSFAEARLDSQEDNDMDAADLEDIRDAALRTITSLDELQATSARTIETFDETVARIRAAAEEVTAPQDSSGQPDPQLVEDMISSVDLLQDLPQGVKQISDLSQQALTHASYVHDLLAGVPGVLELDPFASLAMAADEFPVLDPDLIKQQLSVLAGPPAGATAP